MLPWIRIRPTQDVVLSMNVEKRENNLIDITITTSKKMLINTESARR